MFNLVARIWWIFGEKENVLVWYLSFPFKRENENEREKKMEMMREREREKRGESY
jgi:hypothetical protein